MKIVITGAPKSMEILSEFKRQVTRFGMGILTGDLGGLARNEEEFERLCDELIQNNIIILPGNRDYKIPCLMEEFISVNEIDGARYALVGYSTYSLTSMNPKKVENLLLEAASYDLPIVFFTHYQVFNVSSTIPLRLVKEGEDDLIFAWSRYGVPVEEYVSDVLAHEVTKKGYRTLLERYVGDLEFRKLANALYLSHYLSSLMPASQSKEKLIEKALLELDLMRGTYPKMVSDVYPVQFLQAAAYLLDNGWKLEYSYDCNTIRKIRNFILKNSEMFSRGLYIFNSHLSEKSGQKYRVSPNIVEINTHNRIYVLGNREVVEYVML